MHSRKLGKNLTVLADCFFSDTTTVREVWSALEAAGATRDGNEVARDCRDRKLTRGMTLANVALGCDGDRQIRFGLVEWKDQRHRSVQLSLRREGIGTTIKMEIGSAGGHLRTTGSAAREPTGAGVH